MPRLYISAESEGFEPPEVLPSTVFKTAAIDRSANSPFLRRQKYTFFGHEYYDGPIFRTIRYVFEGQGDRAQGVENRE